MLPVCIQCPLKMFGEISINILYIQHFQLLFLSKIEAA
uniref:Uncharacterized protein n=1 Tax=Anguilla anguilla TaxID=7936 RepID=A0A0E9VCT7_ANGAN